MFASLDSPSGPQARAQGRLPNFIIVYADDMGYADIRPFSTRTGAARPQTPNLDRMATRRRAVHQLLRRPGGLLGVAHCAPHRLLLEPRRHPGRARPHRHDRHQRQRGDDRRDAETEGLRHGHLRQMAPRSPRRQFLPTRHGFDELLRPAVLERHVAAPPARRRLLPATCRSIDGDRSIELDRINRS